MFSDIKDLGNPERVENWHTRACVDIESNEFAMSFISSWIAFNHIYGVYASHPDSTIGSNPGDKKQVVYFSNSTEANELLNEVKQSQDMLNLSIQLPVISVLTGDCVPNSEQKNIKIVDMECSDLFAVIYQVRNNLFHGSKDPLASERDEELCKCLSKFLLAFNGKFIETYF
ncbi:hypothetical protein [Shewanella algae]|uniref:hypothetical protein n=1 Tax=Shewanella algae TaxID=38313 RepID=UPI000BB5AE2C|nr:hypothetical protein [Shewanella algae]PBQ29437.1 hypothetical protein AYI97_00765 [Shewanella algae]